MILQLTDYAVGILASNPTPTLDVFKIGSDYNFVPAPTDTNIHGTLLFEGLIAAPNIINANVVRYTVSMDNSVGDFSWGNIGFFYQGQLFALAASNVPQLKYKVGATPGNQVRLDAYLTIVGTNYNMVVDQADSSNQFQMASLSTVDQLPPSNLTTPNAYVISGANSEQSSFLAYTDRQGLWNFDTYQFSSGMSATVQASTVNSVTIPLSEFLNAMAPTFFGEVIIEFATGRLYSICRYVKTATTVGQTVVFGFDTSMAVQPVAGDKLTIYVRNKASAQVQIPIATTSVLGGIIIGTGLTVSPTGLCSVDISALGLVKSVNTKTPDAAGAVTITAADITGLAAVATTGRYADLLDLPLPYTLPAMSTAVRGGARVTNNGNLTVTGDVLDLGFAPIKTVNNQAPDAGGNVNVTVSYTLPAATPTTRGGITVGPSLTVTASGVLDYTLPIANAISLGGVKQGSGISIAADGTISSSTPIATAFSLGTVIVGGGLTINASGLLQATVRTVNGASPDANGNVTVPSDDTKLNRVQGVATALRYLDIYMGERTPALGMPIDLSLANSRGALFTASSAGTINWTFTGWPASGYTEVQVELTNAGLATTHAFPAAVQFILPDGTVTSSYAAVLNAQRGTTNFQTNGKDFLCFWSRDGGTSIHCKIM